MVCPGSLKRARPGEECAPIAGGLFGHGDVVLTAGLGLVLICGYPYGDPAKTSVICGFALGASWGAVFGKFERAGRPARLAQRTPLPLRRDDARGAIYSKKRVSLDNDCTRRMKPDIWLTLDHMMWDMVRSVSSSS